MSKRVSDEVTVDFDNNFQKLYQKNQIVEKNWGREVILINNENICSKILILEKGRMCSIHYHKVKDEMFHFTDGYTQVELWNPYRVESLMKNNNERELEIFLKQPSDKMKFWPGSSIHIPPGMAHRFTGIDLATFIEVSTHDSVEDSYRIVPSPPR